MKRTISFILAVVILCSLGAGAMAATIDNDDADEDGFIAVDKNIRTARDENIAISISGDITVAEQSVVNSGAGFADAHSDVWADDGHAAAVAVQVGEGGTVCLGGRATAGVSEQGINSSHGATGVDVKVGTVILGGGTEAVPLSTGAIGIKAEDSTVITGKIEFSGGDEDFSRADLDLSAATKYDVGGRMINRYNDYNDDEDDDVSPAYTLGRPGLRGGAADGGYYNDLIVDGQLVDGVVIYDEDWDEETYYGLILKGGDVKAINEGDGSAMGIEASGSAISIGGNVTADAEKGDAQGLDATESSVRICGDVSADAQCNGDEARYNPDEAKAVSAADSTVRIDGDVSAYSRFGIARAVSADNSTVTVGGDVSAVSDPQGESEGHAYGVYARNNSTVSVLGNVFVKTNDCTDSEGQPGNLNAYAVTAEGGSTVLIAGDVTSVAHHDNSESVCDIIFRVDEESTVVIEGKASGHCGYPDGTVYIGEVELADTAVAYTGFLVGLAGYEEDEYGDEDESRPLDITKYFSISGKGALDAVLDGSKGETASGRSYYTAETPFYKGTETIILTLSDLSQLITGLSGFENYSILDGGRSCQLTYDGHGGMNALVFSFKSAGAPRASQAPAGSGDEEVYYVVIVKPYAVDELQPEDGCVEMKFNENSGIAVTEEQVSAVKVRVDGAAVDGGAYSIVFNAETKDFRIVFSDEFLKTLSPGEHIVEITIMGFVYQTKISV